MNKLPKEWSDVATGQFIELTRILERSYSTELDRNIDLLATLKNTTRAEIEAMRISDIKADVRQTAFLSDISSMPTALPAFFTLKGKLYDVQLDITKITGYQLIDLMSFTRVPSEIPQNIHNIMAVMAIPRRYFWKKGSYSGDRHPQLAQLFYERLPITISRPLALFFWNVWSNLPGGIVDCSLEKLRETEYEMQKVMKNLKQSKTLTVSRINTVG